MELTRDTVLQTDDAISLEQLHVHQVYDEIASHFSDTRYKPWPIVEKYLVNQPHGSLGLDVGCGNGKYLNINSRIHLLGCDRSPALCQVTRDRTEKHVDVADCLNLPYCHGRFDFAISIAVIHHLATRDRRVQAIRGILALLRTQGTALIYVWALEQESSRRGWRAGMQQDVMVPWVLHGNKNTASHTKLRYYHLYKDGELVRDCEDAGGVVVQAGYEKDNWWIILQKCSGAT